MRSRVLAVVMVFIVVFSSLVVGCGDKKVNAEIATQVAKDWTSANLAYISDEITNAIGENVNVNRDVLYSIIEGRLANVPDGSEDDDSGDMSDSIDKSAISDFQVVTWTYSEPEQVSDTAYTVIARTTLTYDIPQTGSGTVDVGFELSCSSSKATPVDVIYYTYEYNTSLDVLDDDDGVDD